MGDTHSASWMDDVASAARAAWLGVETSALIASSPAAPIVDHVTLADPTIESGMMSLSDAHQALAEAATAKGSVKPDDPVTDGQTESLMIDPVAELGWGDDVAITDDFGDLTGSDGMSGKGLI